MGHRPPRGNACSQEGGSVISVVARCVRVVLLRVVPLCSNQRVRVLLTTVRTTIQRTSYEVMKRSWVG